MLERIFRLNENGTTVRTEVLAGITTFLTMAYIIFLQPAILSGKMFGFESGMDFGAVTTATCLSAALASAIMGLYARYPIAQAPGMGQNFFFIFSAVPAAAAAGFQNAWQVALGAVFISGVLFLLLSLFGARQAVMSSISPSLQHAIAGGIGLFIAFIGFQNCGLVLKDPGTAVKLNPHFNSPDLVIFFFGLLLTALLTARGIKGAILWGIGGATLSAILLKLALPIFPAWSASKIVAESNLVKHFALATGVISSPPSISPTLLKMDLAGALTLVMWPVIIVFLFMVFFDTVGTLVGVAEQAGLMKDGKLPRAQQAFASDALGTIAGAALGTSTVTSYIESASGVQQGGRTGLTSLVAGLFFLLALFFSPVISMIGSYGAITAPALVLIGVMMMRQITRIAWDDFTEAFPAFLVLVGMPFTFSIADGLALGFIAHPLVKVFAGRGREVKWFMHLLGLLLIAYFVFIRSRIG